MIRAWCASDRFEGRSSARTWLYKIAGNVCFDMLRSRKQRAGATLGELGLEESVDQPGRVAGDRAWC